MPQLADDLPVHVLQRNPAALPAEVQAFVKGNAVPDQIIGALTNDGDPNLLLQVRIRRRQSMLPATVASADHASRSEQTQRAAVYPCRQLCSTLQHI